MAGTSAGEEVQVTGELVLPELLTNDEKEVLNWLSRAQQMISQKIITGDSAQAETSRWYCAQHIITVQHAIMANAAARRYPAQLPLLGAAGVPVSEEPAEGQEEPQEA